MVGWVDNMTAAMRVEERQSYGLRGRCPSTGVFELICGCMFAGKTERLIDHVHARHAKRVQVFKHAVDDRYHPTRVVSHNGRSCEASPILRASKSLKTLRGDTDLVAIDEGHFFGDNLPDVCAAILRRGADVVVAALDNDSWGCPFPMIDALRNLADVVSVKTSVCAKCSRPATRTQRLTPITDNRFVGGAESFEPRCVQCWTPPPASPGQITRDASNTGPWVQHSS